ncbi:MAG: hypothetical protein AB1529_07340, partial [Candidatus Micrarchaeota archaeon]
SACEGNIATVKSGSAPVSGARVRLNGSTIGDTNGSGKLAFSGCGGDAELRATKPGYLAGEETFELISCAQCAPPVEPPQPPECLCGEIVGNACVEFECCSDLHCAEDEYCQIPGGKTGGQCKPVLGCGTIRNHGLEPFECGDAPGCPSCPQDELCIANACVSGDLRGPETGFVGDNATVNATEDEGPCALCDVRVRTPAGLISAGRTDGSGRFTLPLELKGTYTIELLKNGTVVKVIEVKALPKAEPLEPEKPAEVPKEDYSALLWLLLLAAAAAILFLYWKRRKKEKGRPKEVAPKAA